MNECQVKLLLDSWLGSSLFSLTSCNAKCHFCEHRVPLCCWGTGLQSWRGTGSYQWAILLILLLRAEEEGCQGIRSWWLFFSKYIVLTVLWFTDPFASLMSIMSTSLRKRYTHPENFTCNFKKLNYFLDPKLWIASPQSPFPVSTLLEMFFMDWVEMQCEEAWMFGVREAEVCLSGSVLMSCGTYSDLFLTYKMGC